MVFIGLSSEMDEKAITARLAPSNKSFDACLVGMTTLTYNLDLISLIVSASQMMVQFQK